MRSVNRTRHDSKRLTGLTFAIVLVFLTFAKAALSEDAPVMTQQQAEIGGKLMKYTAEVGRIAICDVETGEPHGYMFYTAYRMPSSSGPRPLTFVWNGGPGADSALLHFSIAGPKLARDGRLVDNPDSWLPATDLVLVDPVGTGFSRPAKAEYGAEFYSTAGDVASVTEFVRAWRLLHGSEDAPLFLAGESWGAGRAASVAYALEKRGITVNGLVLISGGWGLNKAYGSAELRSALPVVDMATTALYYGKTAPDLGNDLTTVRQAAEAWVRQSYAPALARLAQISDAERTAILAQLARFTGLAQDQLDRQTLVITARQFRTGLLKDQNKKLYIFDLRRTAAPENLDAPVILSYFRHELGYRSSLPYIGLEDVEQGFAPTGIYPEPVNERWNYATAKVTPGELKAAVEAASARGDGPPRLGPPLPGVEEALAINPRMKVLVAAGMYDSFLPCAVGGEIANQLPANLRQAISFKCYVGGHAMYEDPPTRAELTGDVKALIEANRYSPLLVAPASSHHTLHLGEVTILYVAAWSSMPLKDSAGVAQATISATSYVREDVSGRAGRPIVFAFNGGPGASSTPLHFGVLGPRRFGPPDSNGGSTFLDNFETLLDAADLVLIDPVGTGFSGELRPGGGRSYWNPEGDSKAVEEFIRTWLHDNGRTSSPLYIVGESYGGYRLAEMAKDITDLNVAGVVLVSPGSDVSGEAGMARDQQFVFALPSMATAAYAHGKTQTEGRTVEQVFEEARALAESEYVLALEQGSALAPQERGRLAERMAKLIGLPPSTIAAANLRIETQDFLEQLLPGQVVGRIDTRVAAPKPGGPLVAGRPKAADDPALHMGASNIIKSARARDYLRNEVGVITDLDYISLTLDVNFAWDWNSGSHKLEDYLRNVNPTPNLAKLMKEKPASRLLLLSGYYDLATPVLYQRYAITHAGLPLDRSRMIAFAAGHSVYEDDDTRRQVSKALHNFIARQTNTTGSR